MSQEQRSIIPVNGRDIVVFVRDAASLILASATIADAFINAVVKYVAKTITLGLKGVAREITIFIGDTIAEVNLSWRASKIKLDIATLEMTTRMYDAAIRRTESDPDYSQARRDELKRRLEEQYLKVMDKYAEISY